MDTDTLTRHELRRATLAALADPPPVGVTARFAGELVAVTDTRADALLLVDTLVERPAMLDQHPSGVWRIWRLGGAK